jgi:PilZ domain-containing protein
MSTHGEHRRYPRAVSPKRTLLAWQAGSKKAVSYVANASLGGLFIRALEPPPTGTAIQMLLDAPVGEVRARALVQWSKPKQGMGVKFIAMRHEDRGRLAQWLKTLPL